MLKHTIFFVVRFGSAVQNEEIQMVPIEHTDQYGIWCNFAYFIFKVSLCSRFFKSTFASSVLYICATCNLDDNTLLEKAVFFIHTNSILYCHCVLLLIGLMTPFLCLFRFFFYLVCGSNRFFILYKYILY